MGKNHKKIFLQREDTDGEKHVKMFKLIGH